MSVRRRKWLDPVTGQPQETWMVDVVYQQPDGRKTRIRKVCPVQTKRGAEQYERELRQSLLDGSFGRKEESVRPTIAEFASEFIQTYAVANNKPSEVESKRIAFRLHIVPFLGRLRLNEVGRRDLERFKARKLEDGLSPKTINNLLTILRRMLSLAVEWQLIEHIPPVKWLKVPEPDFDFLTFEEAERLLGGADSDWRTMILVGLKAGLRVGELMALRWEDVDLVTGRIVVRRNVVRGIIGTPKSGRKREIPLGRKVLAALKAHRHLRGELVFSASDGRMLKKGEAKWPLWRACRRAGLRRIGWHALRHTFASHLVMRGAPLKAVQELMGHSTIEMTMRYAHLSPDVRREAAELLDVESHGTIAAHDRVPAANDSGS